MVLYGILAIYFSSVMIRLMLVLAPAACVLSAVGCSELLEKIAKSIKSGLKKLSAEEKKSISFGPDLAFLILAGIVFLLFYYLVHSTWTGAEAYSSPSVILSTRRGGTRIIIDDYREAY